MTDTPAGLLLCDDLIFISRVAGTAQALGLTVRSAKTAGELLRLAEQSPPRCVIVDLHNPSLDAEALASALVAHAPRPTLVGYGSHVDTETLNKARAAGYDIVWPRSKFVQELATEMPAWFNSVEKTP